MKHQRLSAIFVAVSAASLLMVSTAGIAAHKSHKTVAAEQSYKGEANFKAEVPPPCPPVMMLHDGFYIGVGVGYDSYRVHQATDLSVIDLTVPAPGNVEFTSAASGNSSATGWMGGIFAGYGRYFDWFYLAAEINASTSNADTTTNYNDILGNAASATMKARTSYGIALLPGIKVNDSSLLYARLGYLRTNFKANGSFSTVDPDDLVVNTVATSSSEWRNGFNYGVGLETYVAEDVSIRGEYTHTSFNSKTATGSFVNTTTQDSFNATDKYDLSNNEFMLSLMYHFA